ncbi:MAG TPA: hypothetical protein VKV17_07950 [Bryobacteraceae bacterium]|nr:hypothetical protein [Bryobacteraceae bacterium]
MAHVTTSLNWLERDRPLTAAASPARGTTPLGARTSAASSETGPGEFQKLFGSATGQPSSQAASPASGTNTPAGSSQAAPVSEGNSAPTPESVFGSSPWLANPIGTNPDGSQYSYNPWYFATPQAAAQVAQMLGGTVVSQNAITNPGSPFAQQQPNLMVQMPNGKLINAGLVASFYAHGYPQSYIDTLISNEINGGEV